MTGKNIITEEMYEVEIPILIDHSWTTYEYKSFARGHHVYKDVWSPLIRESLSCKPEPSNIADKDAVAIIRKDCFGKDTVVGHLPQNIAKLSSLFLKVQNTSITAIVTGKRLNRGGGYGLEVPVTFTFYGPKKLMDWAKNKLEVVKDDLEKKYNKCLK